MTDQRFDADVAKGNREAEHMRSGAPGIVFWLILQSLRFVGQMLVGVHRKLDDLAKHQGGCDLTPILEQLDKIEANIQHVSDRLDALETPSSGKPVARIVVRGPVENR